MLWDRKSLRCRLLSLPASGNTYLQQIERVAPYLGELSPWVDTLRHPKRALIVDIPVQMDDG
ncbi:hypothetical protein MJL22_28840, partial [Salmonella enterica subsp. enterica serovar Montevideo]|nr:hypothetical protein [Salmonella enterica subsp. enterica serovar Montevideo]